MVDDDELLNFSLVPFFNVSAWLSMADYDEQISVSYCKLPT
jgi:hypothetical protein